MNFLAIVTPSLRIFSLLTLVLDYKNGQILHFSVSILFTVSSFRFTHQKAFPSPWTWATFGTGCGRQTRPYAHWELGSQEELCSHSLSSPSSTTWASWDKSTRLWECSHQAQLSCWDLRSGPSVNLELTLDAWENPTKSAQWTKGLVSSNEWSLF